MIIYLKLEVFLPEIFQNFKKELSSSTILNKLKLQKNNYLVFSFHREENIDNLKI